MLIADLRRDQDEVERYVSSVHWETTSQASSELFFAVREQDAAWVTPTADAFRVPATIAARHRREARIAGGGPVCASLRDGLANSMAWLARWEGMDSPPPLLDFPAECRHPHAPGRLRAGFMSGGIDSLALFVQNQLDHPAGSPYRFEVAIAVVGIQRHRWLEPSTIAGQLTTAAEQLEPVGRALGVKVVPVATNLRTLDPSTWFWQYELQGAALAGIAHLFSSRVSSVSIAGTWKISHLDRWGSHPLVDPGYGSHEIKVLHEQAHLGRLEKTRIVASRADLQAHVNVCNRSDGGDRNCGRCEKCLRTMLALEALGSLGDTAAFETSTLRPENLAGIRINDRGLEGEYEELVEPLEAVGRHDLAVVIRKIVRASRLRRRIPAKLLQVSARGTATLSSAGRLSRRR
jgi:hypothetical protein